MEKHNKILKMGKYQEKKKKEIVEKSSMQYIEEGLEQKKEMGFIVVTYRPG